MFEHGKLVEPFFLVDVLLDASVEASLQQRQYRLTVLLVAHVTACNSTNDCMQQCCKHMKTTLLCKSMEYFYIAVLCKNIPYFCTAVYSDMQPQFYKSVRNCNLVEHVRHSYHIDFNVSFQLLASKLMLSHTAGCVCTSYSLFFS